MTNEAIHAAHRKLTLDEIDDLSAAEFEQFALRECARVQRIKNRRGVRFFISLVKEGHPVRLSALCLYLVVCTRTSYLNLEPAHWKKTAGEIAEEIDCTSHRVYQMLRTAKAAGLLDYRQSMFKRKKCLEMWVMRKSLYDEYFADEGLRTEKGKDSKLKLAEATVDKLEKRIGRFQPVLAELMGMNGGLLFAFTRYHSERHDGCRRDHHGYKLKFPWMSLETIRKELARLVAKGWLHKIFDEGKEHPRYVAICRQDAVPNIEPEPPEEIIRWAETITKLAEKTTK